MTNEANGIEGGIVGGSDHYSNIYQQQMTKSEVHLAKINDHEERIKQEIREERRRMEKSFQQKEQSQQQHGTYMQNNGGESNQ